MLARLTGRGVRLDETRDEHGLGLAICRHIVDQYALELGFARSSAFGGLAVTVTLKA